jgi:tetratricopeptide (TPR) repeat protein
VDRGSSKPLNLQSLNIGVPAAIFLKHGALEWYTNLKADERDVIDEITLNASYNLSNIFSQDTQEFMYYLGDIGLNHGFDLIDKVVSLVESSVDEKESPGRAHVFYENRIKLYYSKRESSEECYRKAIEYCKKNIEFSKKYVLENDRNRFQHYGYQQLAIIKEKEANYEEAIALCRDALQEGWYGDWEKRIARYTSKLIKKIKQSAVDFEKDKNYEKAIEVCNRAIASGLDGDWDKRIERCRKRVATSPE